MKYILVKNPEINYLLDHYPLNDLEYHECYLVTKVDSHVNVDRFLDCMVPEELYTELCKQANTLGSFPILIKLPLSVRLKKCIRKICAESNIEPDTITAQQFANSWSKRNLLKVRGCGKRTLMELDDIFENLNIEWK